MLIFKYLFELGMLPAVLQFMNKYLHETAHYSPKVFL